WLWGGGWCVGVGGLPGPPPADRIGAASRRASSPVAPAARGLGSTAWHRSGTSPPSAAQWYRLRHGQDQTASSLAFGSLPPGSPAAAPEVSPLPSAAASASATSGRTPTRVENTGSTGSPPSDRPEPRRH